MATTSTGVFFNEFDRTFYAEPRRRRVRAPVSPLSLVVTTPAEVTLRLVESRPFGGGVVSMIYAPAMADV